MNPLSTFQHLLVEHEDDLQRIRKTYFPFLKKHLLTGYNLYFDRPRDLSSRFLLHYMHSDLTPTDAHFHELFRLIDAKKSTGDCLETKVMHHKIYERSATYITETSWDNALTMRYFTFDGEEILPGYLACRQGYVVGEVLQYDLALAIDDVSELRFFINLFKKRASHFKLNYLGRFSLYSGKNSINLSAIPNSWQIPLLWFSVKNPSAKPKNLRDFLLVYEHSCDVQFGSSSLLLSTLLPRHHTDFVKFTKDQRVCFSSAKRYALRAFVEEYLDL